MRALIAALVVLTGCASDPPLQPLTPQQEAKLHMTPTLCFYQFIMASPARDVAAAELANRGKSSCTDGEIREGYQIAVQYQEARQKDEAIQAAGRREKLGRFFEVVIGIAAAGAAAQASLPTPQPPNRPLQCHTSYTYGGANTTCH